MADLSAASGAAPAAGDAVVWVVAIDDSSPAVEHIHEALCARLTHNVRLVALRFVSARRRTPNRISRQWIVVDGNALSRATLVRAVAAVAGRATMEGEAPWSGSASPRASAPSRTQAIASGKLILVAEDNETNCKVILRQLALLGYAADVAGDGRDALERWLSGDYALLLTDLHMPRMDGYDLTRAIRRAEKSDGAHAPIIALTANAVKGEADQCRVAGMNGYLTKPVSLADFGTVLNQWLSPLEPTKNMRATSEALLSLSQRVVREKSLDVGALQRLVGNDRPVLKEFLEVFCREAESLSADIVRAIENGRAAEAGVSAHKLKSAARTVGAMPLAEICAQLDPAGEAEPAIALEDLLPRFRREVQTVLLAVQNWMAQAND